MAEQIRTRPRVGRLIIGGVLFVTGLSATISSLWSTSAGAALAVALPIGGVLVLASLLAPLLRRGDTADAPSDAEPAALGTEPDDSVFVSDQPFADD